MHEAWISHEAKITDRFQLAFNTTYYLLETGLQNSDKKSLNNHVVPVLNCTSMANSSLKFLNMSS